MGPKKDFWNQVLHYSQWITYFLVLLISFQLSRQALLSWLCVYLSGNSSPWRDGCKRAHFQWLLYAGIPRFSPFTEFKISLSSHPSFKTLYDPLRSLLQLWQHFKIPSLPNFASLTLYKYCFQEHFPNFNLQTPILLSLPNVCAD